MSAPARPTRVKRNANFAERATSRKIGGEREHRARSRRDAVDGSDDRQRRVTHRLDDRAAHPGEVEQLARAHPLQLADDLLDVTAGAEAAAFSGEDEDARVAAVRQLAEQVAEVGVDVEGERVQLVGARERDRRDAVLEREVEVLPAAR